MEYTTARNLIILTIAIGVALTLIFNIFEAGEDIGKKDFEPYSEMKCDNACPDWCDCVVRSGSCLISKVCISADR